MVQTHACAGPTSCPIFHLHLLRRCNLRCLHCYSSSGPSETDQLALEDALAAVSLASTWGYTALAISGGEPLLYAQLESVVRCAHDHGMQVSVVTNGLLCDRPSSVRALRLADAVTVSVDGIGPSHDRMRGRVGASAATAASMARLSDVGIRFGSSCGVHAGNLTEIQALAELLAERGAHAVNFHAIELAGRAGELMSTEILDDDERTLLYVATHLLKEQLAHRIDVHCDLLHKDRLLEAPWMIYGGPFAADSKSPASDLGVLVLEPDGMLVPVSYGFDRRFMVGELRHACSKPSHAWAHFEGKSLPHLRLIGATLLERVRQDLTTAAVNPSELLCSAAADWPVPAF
jgi:MoaA/NifB/PqqE/SkfB family radical SAM enzyme